MVGGSRLFCEIYRTFVGHIAQIEAGFRMSCSWAGDNLAQNRGHILCSVLFFRRCSVGVIGRLLGMCGVRSRRTKRRMEMWTDQSALLFVNNKSRPKCRCNGFQDVSCPRLSHDVAAPVDESRQVLVYPTIM